MDSVTFERFRQIIYEKSGIALGPDKVCLLGSRIQRRLRDIGLKSESDYLNIIETDLDGAELGQLIDAVSTNTTYFWREAEHFAILSEILKNYRQTGKSSVRIWCAAASSGQEPYTLAMEALEQMPPPKFDVRILASDVSTRILKIALAGEYSEQEVSKLPLDKRNKFLERLPNAQDNRIFTWRIRKEVSQMVLFKKLNLIEQPYPLKGPLDIIFCRNVMIYFDLKTRQSIIDQFEQLLAPGGYLFLSLSESLLGIQHNFTKFSTSVYLKGA